MNAYFIAGTDTGVGKTLVTAAIAAALSGSGRSVGVMKPCESGCAEVAGELEPRDAIFLRAMSGCGDPLDSVCPYRLRARGQAGRQNGYNCSHFETTLVKSGPNGPVLKPRRREAQHSIKTPPIGGRCIARRREDTAMRNYRYAAQGRVAATWASLDHPSQRRASEAG